MQQIDREVSEKYGILPIILMENAGSVSARYAQQMLKHKMNRIAVFCGQGNNGGDGFVCARHLINCGFETKLFFLGKKNRFSAETKINYRIFLKMGQRIHKADLATLKRKLENTDLIVDALLGIGLKGKLKQPYFSVIELINNSQKPVLSLDVPSGLDATSGRVCGIAVRAKTTITFGLCKKGLLSPEAKKYTGKLVVADIGLPRNLLQ